MSTKQNPSNIISEAVDNKEQNESGKNYKQRIRIRLKAFDCRIIDKSAHQIIETAERTGANIIGPIPLPSEKKITTVLRSPHVHKDSREQFEMRIHKRLIDVLDPSNSTIDSLMSLDLPSGVDVEIKMS